MPSNGGGALRPPAVAELGVSHLSPEELEPWPLAPEVGEGEAAPPPTSSPRRQGLRSRLH